MKMEAEQHQSFVCGVTTIKQESVETDPSTSPNQEIEDTFIKEETLEYSPSDDFPGPSTQDSGKMEDEECEEDMEDAMSEGDGEELKDEAKLTHNHSAAESTVTVGVEDNSGTDGSSGLITKHRSAFGNNNGTKHLVHRCTICKKAFGKLEDLKEHTHEKSRESLHSCSVRSKKHQFMRISTEQRTVMLDFMMKHAELATGRYTGPDGVRHKQKILQQLATELNSLPNGTSKTADKWMKSWQDWRSDVKAKASLVKKELQKTGGELSTKAKPLTPLEERLLDFLGPCTVYGHEEVPDPLTIAHQDSGQVTQNDSDNKDTMEMDEYAILPVEGLTIMSASDISSDNVSPALTTAPLASPEESTLSSTSGFVPASHITESSCGTTTEKKGKCSSASLPSPEESVPSTSVFIPVSHITKSTRATTTAKKRKRSSGGTLTKDDDPLVDITRQQVMCMQEQNAIRREQLQLEERRTVAIENAAEAFVGVMKVLEEYLRHRRDNE
ncbi:uncharacterized protein LOC126210335 isoform X1 [Schistocerca nitens]|uniref:uncharacterized protein LOC126210335 isoform X1 n=3 Tax=Schistocerca nitens TaxID=7011 RepID=UPI002117AD7B|nr:uncharacterized protein LOC126210335 isoform X1 [Schistocerca nitens]